MCPHGGLQVKVTGGTDVGTAVFPVCNNGAVKAWWDQIAQNYPA